MINYLYEKASYGWGNKKGKIKEFLLKILKKLIIL